MNISTKRVKLTEHNIDILNALGKEALNIESDLTFYNNKVIAGNALVYGTYVDKKLEAAIYVSDFSNTLYIELLFVSQAFRNKKDKNNIPYHLGRKLLREILYKRRQEIEEYYHNIFSLSMLEAENKKAEYIYKQEGYRETSLGIHLVKSL